MILAWIFRQIKEGSTWNFNSFFWGRYLSSAVFLKCKRMSCEQNAKYRTVRVPRPLYSAECIPKWNNSDLKNEWQDLLFAWHVVHISIANFSNGTVFSHPNISPRALLWNSHLKYSCQQQCSTVKEAVHVQSCGAMGKFEKSLGSNFAERPVSNRVVPQKRKASENVSSNKRAIIYKSCHHGSF